MWQCALNGKGYLREGREGKGKREAVTAGRQELNSSLQVRGHRGKAQAQAHSHLLVQGVKKDNPEHAAGRSRGREVRKIQVSS